MDERQAQQSRDARVNVVGGSYRSLFVLSAPSLAVKWGGADRLEAT